MMVQINLDFEHSQKSQESVVVVVGSGRLFISQNISLLE